VQPRMHYDKVGGDKTLRASGAARRGSVREGMVTRCACS
jgi:hypothetical protein